MNEKISPQENNKNPELEALLKLYPLPEKHQDKAELAFELKKIINSLHEKDSKNNNFKNWNAFENLVKKLRIKYVKDKNDDSKKGEGDYFLSHLISGSTGAKTTEFDFPGEDSIEKFLRTRALEDSQEEGRKAHELEALLSSYPLSEEHKDKAELALELYKIKNILFKNPANDFKNMSDMADFGRKLQEKYKDTTKYWIYNMLAGSTGVTSTEFDFPGDDSVEKFLRMR